ncbi:hypothetical protein AB6A40_003763 [Gnathostoma spinigerum]|uniref:Uncharacterized protein n=1 Tax=Gnathostoma spinigerum TaxID=75299 RepID=A0ABD6EAH2_9BILA
MLYPTSSLIIQSLNDINRSESVLATALGCINYAELPISIVAVITDYMRIPLDEVSCYFSYRSSEEFPDSLFEILSCKNFYRERSHNFFRDIHENSRSPRNDVV